MCAADQLLIKLVCCSYSPDFIWRSANSIRAEARNVGETSAAAVEKRAPSPGLDGVNLNMAEGQLAELTFVETRAVGEDESIQGSQLSALLIV